MLFWWQSLEVLFCSLSYAVGNAAVLGTTSAFRLGGLAQDIAPSERLASEVPHFNRTKRCGTAPEGSPFLFCLAGYVTDKLIYLHSDSRSHAGLCILSKLLSSDFRWLDYQFRSAFKNGIFSWELELPQGPEGSQHSLPRELFKIDFYLTRELFSSSISWWEEKQRLPWQAFLRSSEETIRKSWHRKLFRNTHRTMQKSIFVNCWLPVGGEGWGHAHIVEGKMMSFYCLITWK